MSTKKQSIKTITNILNKKYTQIAIIFFKQILLNQIHFMLFNSLLKVDKYNRKQPYKCQPHLYFFTHKKAPYC
jgi:hypothetical protein